MKTLIILCLISLSVAACGDGAASNRSKLATVESAYGVALAAAVAYRNLKPCPPSVDVPTCSTAANVATLQRIDRTVMPLIETAHEAVRKNPEGPTVQSLIDAADNAVKALAGSVPK